MKEFKTLNQTFIKSNNQSSKILNRYLYSLIPFILLIIIYNLIKSSYNTIINLLVSISISLIVSITTQYIFNIIKKEKNIMKIFNEDNILTISIILGLFTINKKWLTLNVLTISIIITYFVSTHTI